MPQKNTPAKPANALQVLDKDHGTETHEVAPFGKPEIAAMPASEILTGYAFTKASVTEYIANIRELTTRAFVAQRESVAATVLLGRYCRDVGHDLKEDNPGKFGAWLKENIPGVPYSAIATAMRIAVDLGKKHPELKRIDTPEKMEQLTLLIDGQSLTAFGRALRDRADEGNIVPETGKRKFHPAKVTPAERAENADELAAANWTKAFEELSHESELGNFGKLPDADAERFYGLLGDLREKLLAEVIKPRRDAAARAASRTPAKPVRVL